MRILFLSHTPLNPKNKTPNKKVEELLNSYASPGTTVDLVHVDDAPGSRVIRRMSDQSILTGLHHAMQTPPIIAKVVWAQDNGYDAVIQSNTFDPGVEPARMAVRIPVIGLMRTSVHVATTLSDRIALTVPLAGHVPYTWRILRSYGLDHFVKDIRPIGIYGENLDARHDELLNHTINLMRSIVADTGVETIIPLGGALFPYVVDPRDLQEAVGVPVLNTKSIGISFAEMCVRFGMAQSPATYPSAQLELADFTKYAFKD